MQQAVKLFLSLAMIGTAVISMNATANPMITGGGCPSGSAPVNGSCGSPSNGRYSGGGNGLYSITLTGFAVSPNRDPYFADMSLTGDASVINAQPFEARLKAKTLAKCNNSSGGGCEYVRTFQNECIAVAKNPMAPKIAYHIPISRQVFHPCDIAKREAVAFCQRETGQYANQCKIVKTSNSLW